jgi:hypothetical protein
MLRGREKLNVNNMEIVLFIGILIVIIYGIVSIYPKVQDEKLLKTVTSLHQGIKTERKLVLQLLKKEIQDQHIENINDILEEKQKLYAR